MEEKTCFNCVSRRVCSIYTKTMEIIRTSPDYVLDPMNKNNAVSTIACTLGKHCLQYKME